MPNMLDVTDQTCPAVGCNQALVTDTMQGDLLSVAASGHTLRTTAWATPLAKRGRRVPAGHGGQRPRQVLVGDRQNLP